MIIKIKKCQLILRLKISSKMSLEITLFVNYTYFLKIKNYNNFLYKNPILT